MAVNFVRIVNPKKPGEFLVLAERDFDPAVHQLFEDAPASDPSTPAATASAPAATGKGKKK